MTDGISGLARLAAAAVRLLAAYLAANAAILLAAAAASLGAEGSTREHGSMFLSSSIMGGLLALLLWRNARIVGWRLIGTPVFARHEPATNPDTADSFSNAEDNGVERGLSVAAFFSGLVLLVYLTPNAGKFLFGLIYFRDMELAGRLLVTAQSDGMLNFVLLLLQLVFAGVLTLLPRSVASLLARR